MWTKMKSLLTWLSCHWKWSILPLIVLLGTWLLNMLTKTRLPIIAGRMITGSLSKISHSESEEYKEEIERQAEDEKQRIIREAKDQKDSIDAAIFNRAKRRNP